MSEPEAEADDLLAPSARAGPRWRVGIGAAVVLLALGIGVAIVAGLMSPGGGVRPVSAAAPSSQASAITAAPTPSGAALVVHVLGQVTHPGVYELAVGTRVIDAIGAAGGFAEAADQGALNLARQLVDGEQIIVTRPGETPPEPAAPAPGEPGVAGGASAPGQKVDLNSATLDQLQTLPRIGPALAQRIVDWRAQNGRFASVEDLRNVAGIGDKTFADLKDLVMAG